MSAVSPGHEVAAVQLGRDVHREPAAPQRRAPCARCRARRRGSCRPWRRRPSRARRASRGWRPRCRGRARAAGRTPSSRPRRSSHASGIFSQMPIVRSPCTLEWPRTGHAPAPGLPIIPRSSRKSTIACTLSTAFTCCVSPMAHVTMVARDSIATRAAARIVSSVTPLDASSSAHVALAQRRARAPRSPRCAPRRTRGRPRGPASALLLLEHRLHDALEEAPRRR